MKTKTDSSTTKQADKLPVHIQKALDAWRNAEAPCEDHAWLRAAKVHAIKLACDKDKELAKKEERTAVPFNVVVKFIAKESRTTFIDDRYAAEVRALAGLSRVKLPRQSYWQFVRLGRAYKQKYKRIRLMQPKEAKPAQKKLEQLICGAAKQFANGHALAQENIDRLLQSMRPIPNRQEPVSSISGPSVKPPVFMDMEHFVANLQQTYDGPSFRGVSFGVVVAELDEFSAQSLINSTGCKALLDALSKAVPPHGGDVWLCFQKKKPAIPNEAA